MTLSATRVQSYGPEWSQVLRGLVYEAYEAQGSDEYKAKLEAIVDVWAVWPLAEAEMYLDRARERMLRASAEIDAEEHAWYQDVFAQIDERRLDRLARQYVGVARAA